MSLYTNKCPNCAAQIQYNPLKEQFECDFCKGRFSAEELKVRRLESLIIEHRSADTQINEHLISYHCDDCGAELISESVSLVSTCVFCHHANVIKDRLRGDAMPSRIIPFVVDEAEAQTLLNRWLADHRYVRKDMAQKAQVSLSGVYIPFWSVSGKGEVYLDTDVSTSTSTQSGDYTDTVTEHYHLLHRSELKYKNMVFKALDKEHTALVEGIYPFNYDLVQDFSMDYFSGYEAEMSNVARDNLKAEAEKLLFESIADELENDLTKFNGISMADIRIRDMVMDWHLLLLPVWIYTFSLDSEAYYFIINGQSGKTLGHLPLNKLKFNGGALLSWLFLFALLVFALVNL